MFAIEVPQYVRSLIDKLESAGYETYAVGGCIRDSISGRRPADWDLCTSAAPDQTAQVFSGLKTVHTGEKHGTIAVVTSEATVEITTFRRESGYSDSRHPDRVQFVSDIREDLARRDFTINALAYSPARGLIDIFGGCEDLRSGTLRCVGKAADRFREDTLRILRALRFMSVYGYRPDAGLRSAIMTEYRRISEISYERIDTELLKFLDGQYAAQLLDEYRDVFCCIIPELRPMIGYDQRSPYHNRDVWHHTLAAVADIPPVHELRLVMLLHDIAKPVVGIIDDTGRGRFVGHPARGAELAALILRRMKFPHSTIEHVSTMIRHHDAKLRPERPVVRKWLGKLGRERFDELLLIRHADASGKYEKSRLQIEDANRRIALLADEIERDGDCITVSSLAISGKDVAAAGITRGPHIGETLDWLLYLVINDEAENTRESLLATCRIKAAKYTGRCIIFSGAPECYVPQGIPAAGDYVIACDRGVLHAADAGVRPDLALGDFDSYSGDVSGLFEVIRAPREKDDTDTLMALREALARGYTDITILGALGGRIDHEYANYQLCAFAAENGAVCRLTGRHSEVTAVAAGSHQVPRSHWKWISLFAAGATAEDVSLRGVKYTLDRGTLSSTFPIGVSNEFTADAARIEVGSGIMLIMLSDE